MQWQDFVFDQVLGPILKESSARGGERASASGKMHGGKQAPGKAPIQETRRDHQLSSIERDQDGPGEMAGFTRLDDAFTLDGTEAERNADSTSQRRGER
jgi:hypothetical protein